MLKPYNNTKHSYVVSYMFTIQLLIPDLKPIETIKPLIQVT